MLVAATTAVLALSAAPKLGTAPQASSQLGASAAELAELRQLYREQTTNAAAVREKAAATTARLSSLGSARDRLWPLPPRLAPHDIPVVTLDRTLTADALQQLLCHECCAVHVRGFVDAESCEEIASRLSTSSAAFSNWNIHQATSDGKMSATEVDKIGVTSGEALECARPISPKPPLRAPPHA